jgi:hypothetical protein
MKLTRQQLMKVAAEAGADPRTVVRLYDGNQVRGLVGDRILAAIELLKFPKPPMKSKKAS